MQLCAIGRYCLQLAAGVTFNHGVRGSNPRGLANKIKVLHGRRREGEGFGTTYGTTVLIGMWGGRGQPIRGPQHFILLSQYSFIAVSLSRGQVWLVRLSYSQIGRRE